MLPIDEILVRPMLHYNQTPLWFTALQVMLSHLEDENVDENRLFKTAEQLRGRVSNEQVTNMLAAAERAAYVLELETPGSDKCPS